MLLWKEELLKMNQQRRTPGPWEEDEGASYTFPKYWGAASWSQSAGAAGTPLLGFLCDSKGLPHPLEPTAWNPVTLHQRTESLALENQGLENRRKPEEVWPGVAA